MSGSDSMHTQSGSKGIITGSFAAVDYVTSILNNYDSVVTQALNDFAGQEQTALRDTAMKSDSGWREIADSINVKYNHEDRQVSYSVSGDSEVQDKAMTLEYGNKGVPPMPLLRNHVLRGQYDSEMKINNKMNAGFMRGV